MAIRKTGPSGEIPSGYGKPSRVRHSRELDHGIGSTKETAIRTEFTRFSPTNLEIGTDIPEDPRFLDKITTLALKRMFAEKK